MGNPKLSLDRYHQLTQDHLMMGKETFDNHLPGSIAHFPNSIAEMPESIARARPYETIPKLPKSVVHLPKSIYQAIDGCSQMPLAPNLGRLELLPLEHFTAILSDTDLYTLHRLRRVNKRFSQVVASLPQYQALARHASNALYAILGLKTSKWITCRNLYSALINPECEECSAFGGYLYLITCRRLCMRCFNPRDGRVPIPLVNKDAKRNFGLTSKALSAVPHMRLAEYLNWQRHSSDIYPGCKCPAVLFDPTCGLQAGIERHGSEAAMKEFVSRTHEQKLREYHDKVEAARRLGTWKGYRPPRAEDLGKKWDKYHIQTVSVVHMPWLNLKTQEVEWGRYCKSCDNLYRHLNPMYSSITFAAHLEERGKIVNGVHDSFEETAVVWIRGLS